VGARPAGEDIEDEFAAVEDFALGGALDFADLRGGEVVVEDHHIGVVGVGPLPDFLQLALADATGGVVRPAALHDAADDHGSG